MVNSEVCGVTMAVPSLRHHLEKNHGRILTQTCGVDSGKGRADMYVVSLPRTLRVVTFPVEG